MSPYRAMASHEHESVRDGADKGVEGSDRGDAVDDCSLGDFGCDFAAIS